MSHTVHDEHAVHDVHHAPKPPATGWRRLLAPGWLRVLWLVPFGFGLGTLLGPGIRWAIGYHPIWQGQLWTTVELVTVPLPYGTSLVFPESGG